MAHIADGIDVDEETNAGDHENHDAGERVEEITPVGKEGDRTAHGWDCTRGYPFEIDPLKHSMAGVIGEIEDRGRADGVKKGKEDATYAKEADRALGEKSAEEEHQRRTDQRKERDKPKMLEEIVGGGHRLA
jgi:hypothetical protein